MSRADAHPDACLTDAEFEALAHGELSGEPLERLRDQVQAAIDDPDAGISHDAVWSRLEQRMKRVARAA